ncbi:MAG TPA: hypothetical protein DEP84_13620 [Chloroflexi bacterium]|nr:hypothetical protein [Chloroflexota bacterium]
MSADQLIHTLSSLADKLEREIHFLQERLTAGTLDESAFDGLESLLANLRQTVILLEALKSRKS